jgi:hypothetical protein
VERLHIVDSFERALTVARQNSMGETPSVFL